MRSTYRRNSQTALSSLETAAVSARGGFACIFSTADEYEAALLVARHAQNRQRIQWPIVMFVGCAVMVAAVVIVLS